MPDNSPQSSDEIDEILGGISFTPEFARTHGGCPPRYEGGKLNGLAEAKHRLTQRELFSRISELKAVLANVPMPTLSYEQVQNRIAQLESQMNKGGQHG